MNITLNLTAVLITLIICTALYKICKLSKNDTSSGNTKPFEETTKAEGYVPHGYAYHPNFNGKDNGK